MSSPSPVRSIQQVRVLSGRAFSARSRLKTIPGPALRFSPGFKSGRAFGAQGASIVTRSSTRDVDARLVEFTHVEKHPVAGLLAPKSRQNRFAHATATQAWHSLYFFNGPQCATQPERSEDKCCRRKRRCSESRFRTRR